MPGRKQSNCAKLFVAAATTDCKVGKDIYCNVLVNDLICFRNPVEVLRCNVDIAKYMSDFKHEKTKIL